MSNMYPPPPREIDLTAHKSKCSYRRSQSRAGMADRDAKKGPPQLAWGHVEIVPSSYDFCLVANGREIILTIHACVAGGGWRWGFRFDCGGDCSDDDYGGRRVSLNAIKSTTGIFHSERLYFTEV
jgi:hypothetical protein